jgi:hypothetical protein
LVGYERFEGRNALAIMAELYSISRLYMCPFDRFQVSENNDTAADGNIIYQWLIG